MLLLDVLVYKLDDTKSWKGDQKNFENGRISGRNNDTPIYNHNSVLYIIHFLAVVTKILGNFE